MHTNVTPLARTDDDFSDAELVDCILAGHKNDFAALILRYQSRIYGTILKVLRNQREAEDVAQEVFFRAYRALGTWNRDASLSTWLYRITVNQCIDVVRRRKSEECITLLTSTEEDAQRYTQGHALDTPERTLLQQELRAFIDAAVNQLSVDARSVITLRLYADLPFDEIAQVLDIPVQTAKMRFYRAKQKLRDILSSQGILLSVSQEGGR